LPGARLWFRHRLQRADYRNKAPNLCFTDWEATYQQDVVLVLLYPGDAVVGPDAPGRLSDFDGALPHATGGVEHLRALGVEAVSLDGIVDDNNRRLVEALASGAWNGVEVAFEVLRSTYPEPGLDSPQRPPVQVTLLGPGAVGIHAVQAAVNYGNRSYRKRLAARCTPG
jgi:hypothetical protein